jgi:predicted nucleic acid-binding protein
MVTAVDSSVILDAGTNDPKFGRQSIECLRQADREGRLIICECVVAEIRPAFASRDELEAFLSDWKLTFVPSSLGSAAFAGEMFTAYRARKGGRERVLADFLIAAHAQNHADRLLARDRGYVRDYFKKLKLWQPQ